MFLRSLKSSERQKTFGAWARFFRGKKPLLWGKVFLLFGLGMLLAGCQNSIPQNSTVLPAGFSITGGTQYDFGDIPIDGGVVSRSFEIQYDGEESLKILGGFSSCGCTTGVLIFDEERSPRFSAQNRNPDWQRSINSGEKFLLEISYDPLFHGPKDLGERQRRFMIPVQRVDKEELEFIVFQVSGNVIASASEK